MIISLTFPNAVRTEEKWGLCRTVNMNEDRNGMCFHRCLGDSTMLCSSTKRAQWVYDGVNVYLVRDI